MTYRSALDISSYLLLLAGFAAVVASGGLAPVSVAFFLLALVISWWRRPLPISSPVQFLAVLGFLAVYVFDLLGSGDLVGATIRLLLLLACFKMLTLGSGRDYLLVYLISFALLLIASVFTLSIVYLVALIIYLFLSVLTLILFESFKGYAQLPAARFSVRGYLGAAVTISVLTLLLAIPIFLAVPRLTVNFLRGQQQQQLTGFSDTVELGDIGALLRSSEVVMRVAVDLPFEQLSPELKWRGIALEHYDGRRWSNKRIRREVLPADDGGSYQIRSRRPGPQLLGQDISIEPLSHLVFGASDIVQVTLRGNRNKLWKDPGDNISVLWVQDQPLQYFVYSEILPRTDRLFQIRAGTVPASIARIYLQLPPVAAGIRDLAERVTAEASTDAERALLLEGFLRGFDYTLENPSGGAGDPLTDFLFSTRAGHCEYFATAQAVMMRLLGIPSRVVNGFRAGRYIDWQGHFTVRQSDAHSWVEGYFPGAGWIEFDPTPPERVRQSVGLAGVMAQVMDTLDVFWTEVITFNRNKQAGFFTSLAREVEEGWQSLVAPERSWRDWAAAGLAGSIEAVRSRPLLLAWPVLAMLVAALLIRFRHRLVLAVRRRLRRGSPEVLVPVYYQALLQILKRRRMAPLAGETPAEFSRRCREALHTDIPERITRLYYRVRWGQRQLDDGELASMAADLKRLERL